MPRANPNLEGKHFGCLEVVERWVPPSASQKETRRTRWVCVCACGALTFTKTYALTSGKTKSCGRCVRRKWSSRHEADAAAWTRKKADPSRYIRIKEANRRASKKWREKNSARIAAINAAYRASGQKAKATSAWAKANPEKVAASQARYLDKIGVTRRREQYREADRRTRAELTDGAVRKMLRKDCKQLPVHGIPALLIEAKRAQLRIIRFIRSQSVTAL